MYDKFLESIPLKLAGIIDPKLECEELRRNDFDGTTKHVFTLPKPMSIADLRDAFDATHGLVQFYHFVPSHFTNFGHSLAYFHSPECQPMFWLTCTTDGTGKVNVIDVELFPSLEQMASALRRTVQLQELRCGTFEYKLSDMEQISYFL